MKLQRPLLFFLLLLPRLSVPPPSPPFALLTLPRLLQRPLCLLKFSLLPLPRLLRL